MASAEVPDGWVTLEGRRFRLVRFGEETLHGEPVFPLCPECGRWPGALHTRRCRLGRGSRYEWGETCRDCGVPIGSIHVLGCCVEECPRCTHQYMGCDCSGSEDEPDGPGADAEPPG